MDSSERPAPPTVAPASIGAWVFGALATFVSLVVPGLGHLIAGRARRGLFWFSLITAVGTWQVVAALTDPTTPLARPIPGVQSLADWLLDIFLPREYVGYLGRIAPFWAAAFLDAARLFILPLIRPMRIGRELRLRNAARHTMRHEYSAALKELVWILRLDPCDAAASQWKALALRLSGDLSGAAKAAARPIAGRCDADFRRRWAPTLRHELDVVAALKKTRVSAPRRG